MGSSCEWPSGSVGRPEQYVSASGEFPRSGEGKMATSCGRYWRNVNSDEDRGHRRGVRLLSLFGRARSGVHLGLRKLRRVRSWKPLR